MAFIKCPECGHEINENEECCSNCGYPIGLEYSNEKLKEMNDSEEENLKDNDLNEKDNQKQSVKRILSNRGKIVIGIVAVLILVMVACIFSNYKKRQDMLAKQNAEVKKIKEYNKYIEDFNSVYSNSLTGAGKAEEVCVLTLNVWQDSIYDDSSEETSKYVSGASDFNEAIANVYNDEDTKNKLQDIKDYEGYVSDDINRLQSVPSELSKAYDAAVEVNNTFKALASLAENPQGSYTSYSAEKKEKVDNYMTAYNTLEAIIPTKKEVPLYDNNGKKIKDDLNFLIYINQMTNKLPGSAKESILDTYQDEAKVNGIKGNLTYSSINNVIWCADWKTEEIDKKDDVLNYLKSRYGEPDSEKEKLVMWTNKNDKTDDRCVNFKINDDSIEISWF